MAVVDKKFVLLVKDCHVEGMPCVGNLDMELIRDSIDKLLGLSLKTK